MLDAALQTYIAEGYELLQEMEDILLRLEQEDDRADRLNALFRAAHTIKGSAGLFGLNAIVSFTHGVESVLDRMRDGVLLPDADTVALLLACRDHIAILIGSVAAGEADQDDVVAARGVELTTALGALLGKPASPAPMATHLTESITETGNVECVPSDQASSDCWHISLRFGRDVLRDGMDPLSFLRFLGTLGRIVGIDTVDDALPDFASLDPETCYLGFEVSYLSDADKKTIEDVFEFVRADSRIRILPPHSRIEDYIALIDELPEEDYRLGEILVKCGTLTEHELEKALEIQQSMRTRAIERPLGEIVVNSGMAAQPVLDAAVAKQAKTREGGLRESHSVRVDADKLDQLINLVGELVIAGAGIAMHAQVLGDGSLNETSSALTRLVEEVRDSALSLRMVQIGATFNRFQRVVRDVAREHGKLIELLITGAETELDKTVVEKISDPLLHLVRNAIDHGIETPERRQSMGKSAAGVLRLNAYHDAGSIVIEVSDDGAGIDKDRVRRKALERGLLQEGRTLDEQELLNMVFEPGFSTADQVTDLSGRGVGMDVVRRNITALRGSVDIQSTPGTGTTVCIRLPLTLAIIDGFRVAVDMASYVVPLEMVLECVELTNQDQHEDDGRNYLNLRGELLPYIRLRDLFALESKSPRRENVVVVQHGGGKAGLVVDDLLGELQTVIKPLGGVFRNLTCVSGFTVLGNGEVALILDIPGLVQSVLNRESSGKHRRLEWA